MIIIIIHVHYSCTLIIIVQYYRGLSRNMGAKICERFPNNLRYWSRLQAFLKRVKPYSLWRSLLDLYVVSSKICTAVIPIFCVYAWHCDLARSFRQFSSSREAASAFGVTGAKSVLAVGSASVMLEI